MTARLRVLASLSLSLAMIAAGCSKPGDEAPPAKADGAAVEPGATPETKTETETKTPDGPAKTETPTPEGKPTPPAPSDASLAAAVASIADAETSYPAELDGLLDLVPAGSEQFVVIRDLDDLLAVADVLQSPIEPNLRRIAALKGTPDGLAEMEQFLTGLHGAKTELRGAGFQIDKGMVVGKIGDDSVVIYAASVPDALPTVLRAMAPKAPSLPDDCGPVPGAEGYVMCSAEAATLAKYAPGRSAAALRTKLLEHLEPADVEGANVLARLGATPSDRGAIAVATGGGLVHVTVGLPDVPANVARFLGSGPATALGMVPPGSSFSWARLDRGAIESQAATVPFMFKTVVGTLTGELLFGTIGGSEGGLVMLAGVTDPAPAGGLLALAGTQLDQLPKQLPDGSKLEAAIETITLGGVETQVLHASVTAGGPSSSMFEGMGLSPDVWIFSAGRYAGLVFGSKTALETAASYAGTGPSPDGVRALPKPLAQGLVDESLSVVTYASFDGLQSPQVLTALSSLAKSMPSDELVPGLPADEVMKIAISAWASISSVSVWMAPPRDKKTIHVAMSLFADPDTAEGKAAMAAMAEVAGGADPATIYGALASTFSSSERASAYQTRAGIRMDGSMTTAAIIGMGMAVAVPALLLVGTRADAAPSAPGLEAPPEVRVATPK